MATADWEHIERFKGLADKMIAAIQAKMQGKATEADVAKARQELDDFWDEFDAPRP